MDSDFMNNLANIIKNGNVPQDLKNMMNNFKNNSESNDNNNFNCNENTDTSNNSNGINPEMLSNIMSAFGNSNNTNSDNKNDTSSDNSESSGFNFNNIDINMLLKMKSIMDKMNNNKNDPRSNLLLSLKPYLKDSRKSKIEQYIQLFNISKVIEALNQDGGENIK